MQREGFDYPVSVELGLENYPERVYEGFTLPAGQYTSLRVILDGGEGKNWWCVLYPPLCTSAAEEREKVFITAGFTDEQYKTITETGNVKYKVKFKILEVLASLFGGIAQLARAIGSYPIGRGFKSNFRYHGPLVKRSRHRHFTAVTGVRFPHGSPVEKSPQKKRT